MRRQNGKTLHSSLQDHPSVLVACRRVFSRNCPLNGASDLGKKPSPTCTLSRIRRSVRGETKQHNCQAHGEVRGTKRPPICETVASMPDRGARRSAPYEDLPDHPHEPKRDQEPRTTFNTGNPPHDAATDRMTGSWADRGTGSREPPVRADHSLTLTDFSPGARSIGQKWLPT
jgi:hypothetical protein